MALKCSISNYSNTLMLRKPASALAEGSAY